jgi:pyruvate dehydrogenase E1 component alpha subunit
LADNPLLPQHRLRDLHATMGRVRQLERRQRHPAAREALLSAVLAHLGPGDLLSGPAADRTLAALTPGSSDDAASSSAPELPPSLRLPLCAGAALGMRTSATDRVTVAYLDAGAREPGWADALAWAQRDQLPLLLVCADTSQGKPSRGSRTRPTARNAAAPLTWTAVQQLAGKIRMPLFPVDGEDAVAVFRVVQESVARARARGGPAILWAILSPERLPRRQQPLARLETYMSARGIAPGK